MIRSDLPNRISFVRPLSRNAAKNFEIGRSAVGGTLNDDYGQDMSLEIVAAGNMGA